MGSNLDLEREFEGYLAEPGLDTEVLTHALSIMTCLYLEVYKTQYFYKCSKNTGF